MRTRKGRDPRTGQRLIYDIDSGVVIGDSQCGSGLFDTMTNMAKAVASKMTSQAAKDIASKAVTKGLEKGAERIGEKAGQVVGEKIYDKFGNKPKPTPKPTPKPKLTKENKGEEVVKLLHQLQPSSGKDSGKSRLSVEFDKLIM